MTYKDANRSSQQVQADYQPNHAVTFEIMLGAAAWD
jgi:hypothetical protein